jgi:hypothetical protein
MKDNELKYFGGAVMATVGNGGAVVWEAVLIVASSHKAATEGAMATCLEYYPRPIYTGHVVKLAEEDGRARALVLGGVA